MRRNAWLLSVALLWTTPAAAHHTAPILPDDTPPAAESETVPATDAPMPAAEDAAPAESDAPEDADIPEDAPVVVTEEEAEDTAAPEPEAPPAPPLPTAQVLYDRYVDALPIVSYQVTVPQDGSVRSAHQLGMVVDPDGVVLIGGHLQSLHAKPFNFSVTIGDEVYPGELLRRVGQLNVSYVRIKPMKSTPDTDAAGTEEEDADAGPPPFAAVALEEGVELQVGEAVWVMGMLPEQTGYAKQIRMQRIAAVLEDPSTVYLLDGTPVPGEAGGLVLTLDGRPAGVVGYELSRQQGGEVYVRHGLPLVFRAEELNTSIAEPREATTDKQKEAWFGILIQPLNAGFKAYFELEDETGCIISNVVRESPAEAAGLLRGDIIVEFQGEPVDVPHDLAVLTFTRSIRDLPIGTEVALKYLREGELQEATVTLGPVPKTAAKADTFKQPAWGLRVRELTDDIVYLLNLQPDITGVVVDTVDPGGPAQGAGLAPGDLIREVNGLPVEDLADYRDSSAQLAGMLTEKIVLFVQRGPRTGFTTLEPDWRLPASED